MSETDNLPMEPGRKQFLQYLCTKKLDVFCWLFWRDEVCYVWGLRSISWLSLVQHIPGEWGSWSVIVTVAGGFFAWNNSDPDVS